MGYRLNSVDFGLAMQKLKQKIKKLLCDTVWKYDRGRLSRFLRRIGIEEGDVLVVHSSWLPANGFSGIPRDFIAAIKDVLTEEGLLVMMSMPYQNESSLEYLSRDSKFNVRRTPSKMGLLSEVFRRGKETQRSLSATHPVLAWGNRAEEFLCAHENCLYPFGEGSPFEKMLDWNAKILTIDAPFSTITFTHFLEDKIAHTLDFPLYEEKPVRATVVDYEGETHFQQVKVLSQKSSKLRQDELLLRALEDKKNITQTRLGNTCFLLVACEDMYTTLQAMPCRGNRIFKNSDKE